MRLAVAICLCALLWIAAATPLKAQAALEYGLGASKSVGAAGAAKGLGDKIGKALGGLDTAVKSQPAAAGSATTTPKAAAKSAAAAPSKQAEQASPPAPKPVYEDPNKIEAGLSYADLIRRFGPPAMEISSSGSRSLTYSGGDGAIQVEVRNDAVASVAGAGQSGVLVLK